MVTFWFNLGLLTAFWVLLYNGEHLPKSSFLFKERLNPMYLQKYEIWYKDARSKARCYSTLASGHEAAFAAFDHDVPKQARECKSGGLIICVDGRAATYDDFQFFQMGLVTHLIALIDMGG